jgi:hypothetical protein
VQGGLFFLGNGELTCRRFLTGRVDGEGKVVFDASLFA